MDNKAKGYGVTSLVCGLVGLVVSIIPYLSFGAWILLIIAIVFGALGKKAAGTSPNGMATAGLILGIIGVALDAISIACTACVACAAISSIAAL